MNTNKATLVYNKKGNRMKRSTLIIIILSISLLSFSMISESFVEENANNGNTSQSPVIELSDKNYSSEVSQGLVIVNYWSPWCALCRHSKPIFEDIAREYNGKVKTARINAATNKRFVFEKNIQLIPSTLIYKDNKEIIRITGRASKEDLKRIIEENS